MKIIEGIKKYSNTDRTALMCNGDKLSYKDLNEYSDAISVFLKDVYKEEDTPIVIYGNKENMIMACMMKMHIYYLLQEVQESQKGFK